MKTRRPSRGILALILLALATYQAAGGEASTPYVFSYFSLTVAGQEIRCDSVEFGTIIELVSASTGEGHTTTPGNFEWLPLTFTHTIQSDGTSLTQWLQDMENGSSSSYLRDFSVSGFDAVGVETLRWDFGEGWLTDAQISFSEDQLGKETVSIIVNNMDWSVGLPPVGNQRPSLSIPASYSAPIGQTTHFTVSASDPDGDATTVTNLQSPATATFSGGTFSWDVPLTAIGTAQTITFRADDGQSAANSTTTKSLILTIPTDFDSDLMDDDWEILWFGNLTAEPGTDSDNDMLSNLDEFRAATSPTNPASRFAIEQMISSNGNYQLEYFAQPGMEYQLESNEQLDNPTNWIVIGSVWTETNSTATSRWFSDLAPATNAVRFYRLKVRRP